MSLYQGDESSNVTKDSKAPITFLSLPSELRNKVYGLCLIYNKEINPWWYQRWMGWLEDEQLLAHGLLLVNKLIHHEASSVLYSRNHFDFTEVLTDSVLEFLADIGPENARCIQNVTIDFPTLFYGTGPTALVLEDEIRFVARIQEFCQDLKIICTSLASTHDVELQLLDLNDSAKAVEVLARVDTCFKTGSNPAKDIVVQVYEDVPYVLVREEMRKLGWKIVTHVPERKGLRLIP